ncbi:hypothetical protein C8J57DRAFT_1246331 [Mycena rebaudengoi]|nr:hypothetical protein C8J57DRAFT_1246331 [Mycena rebaudengoi]
MRTTSHFTLRTEADAGLPTEQSTERETNGIPGPSQPSYATDTVMGIRKYFYEAQYDEVSGFLGLGSKPFEEWDDLYVPDVMLPTSAIKNSHREHLQTRRLRRNWEAKPKSPSFFGGILRHPVRDAVPASSLSDGKIEGEVFCGDDLFLFVRVWAAAEFLDDLARVRCELYALWHSNRTANPDGSGFRRRIVKDLGTELVAKPPHTTLKILQFIFVLLLEGYFYKGCSRWPPIDKHADNERQLPTESVPMVAPNQLLNDGPAATEASLQIQERRAQAVEAFWKGMDAEFRRTFKPYMLFKGESFTTLACFAADAKRYREILERRGSKFMVSVLVEKLEMSQKEGHWAVA